MRSCLFVVIITALLLSVTHAPAQGDAGKVLPAPSCADGWTMDGKVALFDKDSLFDRINGESELYFPYGFTVLAYARYASRSDPKTAIDADVYAMGSLLDAFGLFSNYRRKGDPAVAVGAQGTVSPSQVLFFQDRYFVRLQVTGATSLDREVLLSCALAISKNLPQNAGLPKELGFFKVPAVLEGSERYIAGSLLGYDFFRRGLIADALTSHDKGQVFLVIEQTPEAAHAAMERYFAYLTASGTESQVERQKGGRSLTALDPLYGTVYVDEAGRYLIGAIRFKRAASAQQVVDQVKSRAAGEKDLR